MSDGLNISASEEPRKKGDWVTNFPRSLKAMWPRRDAKLIEGPAKLPPPGGREEYLHKGRLFCAREFMLRRSYIGVYLDEDIPEGYRSRKILMRPER